MSEIKRFETKNCSRLDNERRMVFFRCRDVVGVFMKRQQGVVSSARMTEEEKANYRARRQLK